MAIVCWEWVFFSLQPGTGGLRLEAWGHAGSCSWPSSSGRTNTAQAGWMEAWRSGLVSRGGGDAGFPAFV